ncbi:MAG: hypothetical protein ACJZ49_06955 [Candidatus Thalassarchaeaceae archaeon]|tara:strand:+ start:2674 stop:3363 length:690 start_codon:yes stop_codon:yes gene_type:complete
MEKTLPLWDIEEIQDEILDEFRSVPIIFVTFLAIFSGFVFLPYSQIIGTLIIFLSFIPTVIVFKQQIDIRSIRKALQIIGVDDGHPWHPADEGESTKTRVRNVIGEWISLPHSANISIHENIISEGWTIRDEEEEILLHLGSEIRHNDALNMEIYINQALILSRAQEFEQDPTLRDARFRENSAEGFLEREWLDTSPGQVEIEFGQMGRAREILGKSRNSIHSALDSEE